MDNLNNQYYKNSSLISGRKQVKVEATNKSDYLTTKQNSIPVIKSVAEELNEVVKREFGKIQRS